MKYVEDDIVSRCGLMPWLAAFNSLVRHWTLKHLAQHMKRLSHLKKCIYKVTVFAFLVKIDTRNGESQWQAAWKPFGGHEG